MMPIHHIHTATAYTTIPDRGNPRVWMIFMESMY